MLVVGEVLRERDGDEALLRINLAIRCCCAVPAKLSERRWHRKLAEIRCHFHAEAEAFLPRRGLIVWQRRQVVRRHQLDRLATKDAFAFQRAAIAEHLC